MSYICKNPDCSAPENKKGKAYPSAMECPFCDVPLEEVISISDAELDLINRLPYVIAYPLRRTLVEKHAWTKINLLKDTFLNYLKYLGLITASEFFNSPLQDKNMVALFYNTLSEPSFGTWNVFIRETLKFLNENNHKYFCPEINAYYEQIETGKKRKLYKGEIEYIDAYGEVQHKTQEATAIGMLINFRNRYLGHGQTLDEATSVRLWEDYYPIFNLLLSRMEFTSDYVMYKHEHGETYSLQSAEIRQVETMAAVHSNVWLQNKDGNILEILPFFIVPGEVNLAKEDKEQILTYESYTGKTIKFFSPEGTEKQTSGKILERLNLLLRNKQQEQPYTLETFTKDVFLSRIADENKLILDTLVAEKKVIAGVYVHRQEMEIKLREWVGARASIFFIAAEAGSGKTNLLIEMQKQYADWGLQSLLVRVGRMEKAQLAEQIAYMLNIDPILGLSAYPTIAGTQAAPTFILIDGLNEAFHAEQLWKELLELSQLFEPGSLKFVVTSRANTAADLDRYPMTDNEMNLVYGEKKEQHEGLAVFTFWLTALNMEEMKTAWENYAAADKSRYKPLFSFDDIATFDRAIYDQINNPLVLRIFLEVYNRKILPKKVKQHLNIWQDWLQTFSVDEQKFLGLLAAEIWNKGENKLLLDDLLKIDTLKNYLVSDNLNSPYQRLKNLGWVSRYVKDVNVCIGFTVEGLMLYLFGIQLQHQSTAVDISYIDDIIHRNNKLQKAGLESFLSETALKGDLSLITELIDAGGDKLEICIRPLLHFMKSYGVETTLDKLLKNSTDSDWLVLFQLDKLLSELQLQFLRKELLCNVINKIIFENKYDSELGLKAIAILDDDQAKMYYERIDVQVDFIQNDSTTLESLGHCEHRFGEYDKALEFYEKSLDFKLKTPGGVHPSVATSYGNIGSIWGNKGEYDKALEFFQKCLEIQLKTLGGVHPSVATSYNNIGLIWSNKGEYDKALEFFQKCLEIQLKTLGGVHPSVATSYGNIGSIWENKGEYDKALEFFQKCLEIQLKTLGGVHPSVATSYNNIGIIWDNKGEYDKALEFNQRCLEIQLKTLGGEHPSVANSYNNIGSTWNSKCEYDKALEFFQKCLEIQLKTMGEEHPSVANTYNNIGSTWNSKCEYDKALEFNQRCLEIQLKTLGGEHPSVATSYNNIGLIWNSKCEYDMGLEFFQKCLEIQLKTLGGEHPSVATSYNNIGLIWNNKGEYDKALEFFQKCLEIQLKTLSVDHPSVATSYGNIGTIWSSKGESDKAEEFLQKYLNIIEPDWMK
jgi:tetratricopeptide (TPR) repeat protein